MKIVVVKAYWLHCYAAKLWQSRVDVFHTELRRHCGVEDQSQFFGGLLLILRWAFWCWERDLCFRMIRECSSKRQNKQQRKSLVPQSVWDPVRSFDGTSYVHILIDVLFGIDLRRLSPWTAARMTFRDEDSPAARKNRLTSTGAVGWFMTLLYMESLPWVTKISTYGGIELSKPMCQLRTSVGGQTNLSFPQLHTPMWSTLYNISKRLGIWRQKQ